MAAMDREIGHEARLSLFLNLDKSDGPGVRLEISGLEVHVNDAWLPVNAGPQELDAKKIGAGQLFLGGRAVPPGSCQRLRFTVTKGSALRDSGLYVGVSSDPFVVELELPSPILLEKHDSRSLFLTWEVQETLGREDLRPVITIASQIKQMLADLVYAACPDIDTIFVIRSDKNWVADSFGVKGRPTFIAMDPDPSRRRLFVLAAGESAIKVVDLFSQRVSDFFALSLTDAPTFMTVSPDGRWAYVLEERASTLSRIDLTTGSRAALVRLGHRPQYAAYLGPQNLLAVSSSRSQKVSLLHPLELTEIRTITAGDSPQGLLVSGNQLYVAESGDHTVSIFNLSTNLGHTRLEVGFGPRRLLDTGNYIYVSNYEGGSLSLLLPGVPGVVREVPGLDRPLEMVFDQDRRVIYVGEEQAGGLAVIDSVSNLFVGRISLGARPSGLAVLQ
jgi:DNA-binding beta-propeller fold protein YncE